MSLSISPGKADLTTHEIETQPESTHLLLTRLYDASLKGDVNSLHTLLQKDELILDRCIIEKSDRFMLSPLHIAASFGHLDFTRVILRHKHEIAEEIDELRRWSPLHMASSKGHLEIVKDLVAVSPNMCLVSDRDGRNPVHVAAISGQVHVLQELVRIMPQAARERTTTGGGTVLHLCVKYCQIDALKFLINVMDDDQLLNATDCDGNTVLHLAVASKNPEMVKFLLKNKRMEQNAVNTKGLTAMDVYKRSKKGTNDLEIWSRLKKAKAVQAKMKLKPKNKHHNWLDSQRNALMVVASLIATMAFQVGTNPPGGAWQDTSNGHRAGLSIMADVDKRQYNSLLVCNTVGLISSLSVILLLISGIRCIRLFVGILMITMWIAVSATTVSYVISVNFLVGNKNLASSSSLNHHAVWMALMYSLFVWLFLMVLLLLAHAMRLVFRIMRRLMKLGVTSCKGCLTLVTRRPFV